MNGDGLVLRDLTEKIIAAAMPVHTALGPGLLESAYEACLVHELLKADLSTCNQVELPIRYDGLTLDIGYRIDVLVLQRYKSSSNLTRPADRGLWRCSP